MNSKKAKLLRKYAKKFQENESQLKKQYLSVPMDGRAKLTVHMKFYTHDY